MITITGLFNKLYYFSNFKYSRNFGVVAKPPLSNRLYVQKTTDISGSRFGKQNGQCGINR